MNIYEALQRKKELEEDISSLYLRIKAAAYVPEGLEADENIEELMTKRCECTTELRKIKHKLMIANTTTKVELKAGDSSVNIDLYSLKVFH